MPSSSGGRRNDLVRRILGDMPLTYPCPAVLSYGSNSAALGGLRPPALVTGCSNKFMSESEPNREFTASGHDDRVADFLELYTTHYARLQFYVTALLPISSDASDVLQETSMVLWRKFGTFEPGSNFFAWACKIARVQVMKYRERQGRSARIFGTPLVEQLAVEAANDSVLQGVTLQALENCLGKLSESDRSLIRRRYQPGTSVHQLAADVGRTANSLSKSLGRIRRALLECMSRTLAREVRE
jgi:RNA polymerase sigma-70 factor, ECF subfamily